MEKNKWILPVAIALLVVNMILTTIIIIVGLPPIAKINKVVTAMETVLDLEYDNEDINEDIPIDELNTVSLEDTISVNLRSASSDKIRVLRFSYGVTINKNAKDAKKIADLIIEKESILNDSILGLVATKSFEDITKTNGNKELSEEIAELLRDILDTNAIVGVFFTSFLYN
ncbi:MAG: flagellar basal body-associated FliL family protein [Eubacteriales bacterium]